MNISTNVKSTWCPGCPNFMILAGVKKALENSGKKQNEMVIVSGIGCHAKIFDYLNLPGLNSLHGRVPPVCFGLKMGNPNLSVLGFSGDGDAYAEGLEHTIHSARYNSNWIYIVHNNQVFSLTTGQPTPTTEIGYKDKTTPLGVKTFPLNPIKLMLASGASFVARVFADIQQVENVIKEALKHKGFCFIEILQPCLIFHPETLKYKNKIYDLQKSGHKKQDFQAAMKKVEEFDYNEIKSDTKIPVGIFYQVQKPIFEEQFPQLQKLGPLGWKGIKR
ncbi:MAG: 2-oxoacid:ferredoxin oxidoreductase subunit beta [Nanoarchaeota archaeon]|nr:2-oxoacid:ferredoxin oxidoreductase subunit beta [Nanoarchaeota archaeon]MBU1027426.1 2-oxoacid:ferredoxin oxidoreductase subunit beta [Nanoarchaeota archaeon]